MHRLRLSLLARIGRVKNDPRGLFSFRRIPAYVNADMRWNICCGQITMNSTRLLTSEADTTKKDSAVQLGEVKHILHEICIGAMSETEIKRCVSLIFYHAYKQSTPEAAQIAEDLLERLVSETRDGGNKNASVDSRMYNAVIAAYGACKSPDGPEKAEQLFHRMWKRFNYPDSNVDSTRAKPDQATFNTLMNVWAQSSHSDSVEKNEQLLQIMESHDSIFPGDISYNNMMNTYANQIGEYGYAQKAEDVLLKMSTLQKDENGINPDTRSFNIVLKAWKNSGGGIESAHRAKDILSLMMKLFSEGHIEVRPDNISFKTVMFAYLKPHGENRELTPLIFEHVESVIDLLLSDPTLSSDPELVYETFAILLHYISTSKTISAGDRALHVIEKFNAAVNQNRFSKATIPVNILFSIIGSCLQHRQTASFAFEIVERVENDPTLSSHLNPYLMNKFLSYYVSIGDIEGSWKWLEKMEYLSKTSALDTSPNSFSFRTLVTAYAKSINPTTTKRMSSLFDKMMNSFQEGHLKQLETVTFKSIIITLSNSDDPSERSRIYEILKTMVYLCEQGKIDRSPETSIFSHALSACAKDGRTVSASRAIEIFRLLENHPIIEPDTLCFQHLIVAIIRAMDSDSSAILQSLSDKICHMIVSKKEGIVLDKAICESLFQGYAHPVYGNKLAASRFLNQLINLRKKGFQDIVETPSSRMLNLTLKAFCHQKKTDEKEMPSFQAHRFLMQLLKRYERKELESLPDNVGFNSVIQCWSLTKHHQSIDKAEELLNLMRQLSADHPEISPDKYTYTNLLSVFSRNNSNRRVASRAQQIFDKFDPAHIDQVTYNALLTVWSRSKDSDNAIKSREILNRMQAEGFSGIDGYNIVINTFASSRVSWSILEQTFNEMMTFSKPNAWSFVVMTKAINQHMDDDKTKLKMFRFVLKKACSLGLLSEQLMQILTQYVRQIDSAEELFENDQKVKSYADCPKEWKKNLQHGR